jgi:NAD(P)-dependent dehydrogenase (short-subunit alcohol dehydrogenase family)
MTLARTEALDAYIAAEPERAAATEAQIPLGRFGDPETHIGRAVVFLAGPDSRYLTGATRPLDGGSAYLR